MKLAKHGLTLVELLIVLAILAGLVTSVAVSASGVQDRRRAAETRRVGQDIADAWDRGEGLSFVSDFGEAPDSAAKLQLLFRRDYPASVRRLPTVPNRPDPGFEVRNLKQAPAFRKLTGKVTDIVPTDGETPVPVPTGNATISALPPIELYGGWRGPYCSETVTFRNDVACDGFGGAWLLLNADGRDIYDATVPPPQRTAAQLCSFGLDRMRDAAGEKKAWQSKDTLFVLRTPRPTLTLDLDVDAAADIDTFRLHVYIYSPRTDWKNGSGSADPTLTLGCRYYSVPGNSSMALSDGLTVGARAVFVWASDGGAQYYYLPPRYLTLVPGNNTLKGTLRKAN